MEAYEYIVLVGGRGKFRIPFLPGDKSLEALDILSSIFRVEKTGRRLPVFRKSFSHPHQLWMINRFGFNVLKIIGSEVLYVQASGDKGAIWGVTDEHYLYFCATSSEFAEKITELSDRVRELKIFSPERVDPAQEEIELPLYLPCGILIDREGRAYIEKSPATDYVFTNMFLNQVKHQMKSKETYTSSLF